MALIQLETLETGIRVPILGTRTTAFK